MNEHEQNQCESSIWYSISIYLDHHANRERKMATKLNQEHFGDKFFFKQSHEKSYAPNVTYLLLFCLFFFFASIYCIDIIFKKSIYETEVFRKWYIIVKQK